MWTTAATFYGLMFVDFPSLQQLGALIGHSMVICGILTLVLVPALLPRRCRRRARSPLRLPGLAAWVQRRRRAILRRRRARDAWCSASRQCRLRIDPDARPAAVGHARRRRCSSGSARRFDLPDGRLPDRADAARRSSRCSNRTSGSPRRLRRDAARGRRFTPRHALLPSDGHAGRRVRRRSRTPGSRPRRGGRAAANGGRGRRLRRGTRSSRSSRGCRRLLDAGERLTFDGYSAHGLGDLLGRFVARDGGRWAIASYACPSTAGDVDRAASRWSTGRRRDAVADRPAAREPRAGRALPAAVPQRPGDWRGRRPGADPGRAFRDWRLSLLALAPTADRPGLGGRPARAGARASSISSRCSRS